MSEREDLVIVVDDDASVSKSLDRLLRSNGFAAQVFSSGESFLEAGPWPPPYCVVLDLAMPGLNGLELQQRLNDAGIQCGIVFLSGHGNLETGVEAMKHGAVDFLPKPVDEDRLLAAVRESLAGQEELFARDKAGENARLRIDKLTPREHDVMELVVAGRLNKLIAAELDISEKTVKAHRANVMRKTGAKSVAELVRLHITAKTPATMRSTAEDTGNKTKV
jgi:FixJ family two-component response regulator